MAFDNVLIHSLLNAGTPVDGYRQDLASGDLVQVSLNDPTGVTTYKWEIVGRPEGSVAGGAGPEPILLGFGSTASFTVDTDDLPHRRDGTYVVRCTINGGSPSATRKDVALRRLRAGVSIAGPNPPGTPLPLAKLGGFEELLDTDNPLIRQGWAKMLNRWLEFIAAGGGGGGGSLQDAYDFLNGNIVLSDAQGLLSFDGTAGPFFGDVTMFRLIAEAGQLTFRRIFGFLGVGYIPAEPARAALHVGTSMDQAGLTDTTITIIRIIEWAGEPPI